MKDQEQQLQQAIRHYLLGDLEENDRQNLEERFITDNEYRNEVLIVESELVEDFVNGALSRDDQAKFRSHYLSAPRQEKQLRTVRALTTVAGASKRLRVEPLKPHGFFARLFGSSNRKLQFAPVAALVVIAILSATVIFQVLRQKTGTLQLHEEVAQLNTPENLARTGDSVVPVTFPPVVLRDRNSWPKLTLTAGVKAVQFNVPVTLVNYSSYRVDLRSIEGAQIVDFEVRTRPQGGVLPVQLPAHILTPNDYSLVIHASKPDGQVEDIGDFSFRVLPPQ